MLEVLDRKIRQMHAALDALSSSDLSKVRPEIVHTETYSSMKLDFGAKADPIQLANAASLLIANIASIKDHLKTWCKVQALPFNGDKLIDTNQSVALIHDLWNLDKHAELSSRSRSGYTPKLRDLSQSLCLTTGAEVGSTVLVSVDPRTGQLIQSISGGGSVTLAVVASIVDEHGKVLGDFASVCEEAIEAWENELRAAGVQLP